MSQKLNLDKLLYETPSVGPSDVQLALERVFPQVVAEFRDEPFFAFQIRCGDESNRTRLIIRFGYSFRRDCWVFEPLRG
jgi:hypothetical protein